MINIRELLEDPSKLNADTLPELKALVEKYPFFQVVRLLYISNLYKLHSQDFGAELRKASSFVPDRTALFTLTEGINYTLPTHSNDINIETEDEGTRTISLINRKKAASRQMKTRVLAENSPRRWTCSPTMPPT